MMNAPGPLQHGKYGSKSSGVTPGSLGINDNAAKLTNTSGLSLQQMFDNAVLAATGGMGKFANPVAAATAATQFNLRLAASKGLAGHLGRKRKELANALAGQNHDNNVLKRLSAGKLGEEILSAIYRASRQQALDPRFLAAAFFAETDWRYYHPSKLDTFWFIGMDLFFEEMPAMLADGCLPESMEGTYVLLKKKQKNEDTKTPAFKTGYFYKMNDLIWAFAALLAHRRHLMMDEVDAMKRDMKLDQNSWGSPDELDYWNYVKYNTKASTFRYDLSLNLHKHGDLSIPHTKTKPPDQTANPLDNAKRLMFIKRLLASEGMVDAENISSIKLNETFESVELYKPQVIPQKLH